MSNLPKYDQAVIPLEKLRDYALNDRHPYGKHKAKVFGAVLGIGADEAEWLATEIFTQLPNHEAQPGKIDAYGKRYTVDLKIRKLDREAWVRTGWIFLTGTDYPRLTTCYIPKPEEL